MVENPTDEDWAGVKMALISGRPISFKMDLYNPLYINRPTTGAIVLRQPFGGVGKSSVGSVKGKPERAIKSIQDTIAAVRPSSK